jgi:hypothetical protein
MDATNINRIANRANRLQQLTASCPSQLWPLFFFAVMTPANPLIESLMGALLHSLCLRAFFYWSSEISAMTTQNGQLPLFEEWTHDILHLLPTETSGAFTPDCIPGQLVHGELLKSRGNRRLV